MIYYEKGSATTYLTSDDIKHGVYKALDKLGKRSKVLAVPPDFTRYHSRAGKITSLVHSYYKEKLTDILPALGTHAPMNSEQIAEMFPGVPENLFRVHDWRNDVVNAGEIPSELVAKITSNAVNYSWPAQLNKLILNGGHDLILSIGQVVPHEVIGMANYNKNLFVGTGGAEGINKSHFIGAVYGMERLMGRADNPVRQLLNYASENFIKHLPVIYVHTVVGRNDEGKLVTRGLFIGDDSEVFNKAAELSLEINFTMLEVPLKRVVVYLDPAEYKSTWLGNKSIYRTRMALANNAELIVLAPGLKEFGEDAEIDRLIRKYGYRGTPATLKATEENAELKNNLSAAAHLIHGSSEGRFTITYCPGYLSREEIEGVNFNYAPLKEMMLLYNPQKLHEGFNHLPGGEIVFFISNPAVGLWAYEKRFRESMEV
jgi:nickel-dependent lactate racemase